MCNHTTTSNASPEETVAQCRAAVEADPSSSQNWRQLGIALLLASGGESAAPANTATPNPLAEEAITCLRRSLSLIPPAPNRAGTRHALGLALRRSGDASAAAAELERASEARPADARLRADLAKALKECGRLGAAAEAYRAAIRLRDEGGDDQNPAPSNLHYRLGMTLRAMLSSPRHCRSPQQRRKLAREARRCLARQLREDPGHSLAAFWLAALEPEVRGGEEGDNSDGGSGDDAAEAAAAVAVSNAASGCPPKMVAALFDKYAPTFDSHLVGALDYATPRRLADALATAAAAAAQKNDSGGRFFRRVADLGCGTGLMGPLLRPMMVEEEEASHLCGVDLSSRMVEVARRRGCYDALEVGELVSWLLASSSSAFDALVAADVVVYLGDLSPMLEAAAGACSGQGALFAFSTEDADAGDDEEDDKEKEDDDTRRRGDDQDGNNNTQAGFVLRPTGRYAHRAAYIQRAAEAAGWAVASLERRSPLRMNAGKRIWGNLVVLRRV